MDSEGSLKLPSAPLLDKTSLTHPENADSLQLKSSEELGSSLFKEQSTAKDYAKPQRGASNQESAAKIVAEDIQRAGKQFIQTSGQLKDGQPKEEAGQYLSMEYSQDNMMSSLEPEDDSVPHYIRLYRPMIVKCVDCLPLLPQMRDIFDDQGGH